VKFKEDECRELFCDVVDRLEEFKKFANGFTGPFAKQPTPSDVRWLACYLYHTAAYAMSISYPNHPPSEMRGLLDMTNGRSREALDSATQPE